MDDELEKLLRLFDKPLPAHTDILREHLKSYAEKARGISINRLAKDIKDFSGRNMDEANVRRFWHNKSKTYKIENLKCFAAFLHEQGYITLKYFDEHQLSIIDSPTKDLPTHYETDNDALVNPYVGLFANVKSSHLESEPVILFSFSQSEIEGELDVYQSQFTDFKGLMEWELQYPEWKSEAKKLFEARQQGYASIEKLEDELPRSLIEQPITRLYGTAFCPKPKQIEIRSKNAYNNQIYLQADEPKYMDEKDPTEVHSFHLLDNSRPLLDLTNPNATLDRFIYFQRIDEFTSEKILDGYNNYQKSLEAQPGLFRTRRNGFNNQGQRKDSVKYKGMITNSGILGNLLIGLTKTLVLCGPDQRPDIEPILVELIKFDADIRIKTEPNQETLLHLLASVSWPESKSFENNQLLDLLVVKQIDLTALDCEGLLAFEVAKESGNYHLAEVLKNLST